MYRPYPIYDMRHGLITGRKPWLLPQDAFREMLNAYVDNGIIKKRMGYTLWGRLVHLVDEEVIGIGDGSTKTFSSTLTYYPLRDIVTAADSVETFSDNGDGTLTGNKGGTGTIDYDTGDISLTFNSAPGNGINVEVTYNYYPGLPVMGIFEHYTALGRYLMAFDTKRMCRYNSSTKLFEDVTGSDTWTGQDWQFFHVCSATDDKLYITNNQDQIHTWDGTNLSEFVIDYTGGTTNKVNTCKFIFEYYGHLVILAPTEENTYRPRRYRCSAAGTYTSWPSYCWADAPTPDEIMGAQILGGELYVWFKESLWKLRYTGIYTLPFEWERVSPEEGLYAAFSPVTTGGMTYAVGKSSILATDGITIQPIDADIPDYILDHFDPSMMKYIYGTRNRKLRQIWWSFCTNGASHADAVLAYDYKAGTFFEYDLSFHTYGSYTVGSTVTLDDIEEAWDDLDTTWDSAALTGGYPLRLGGAYDGKIYLINDSLSDNGDAITFTIVTADWNPFVLEGKEASLGWVDFLVTVNADTELTVEFYVNDDLNPYQTSTFDCADDSGQGRTMVWKRIYVGCVGNAHHLKIYNDAADQPVEIHAIVPHFAPEGTIL